MKLAHNKHGSTFPTFSKGDHVWLDGKNLKLRYPKAKLAPKRYGPFKVLDTLGPVTYRIQTPRTWRIRNVFHISLLSPYKETPEHGPNFEKPPPELVEGQSEYEVEHIIKSDVRKNGRLMYLVKWKGYPDSDNTWEPTGHLKHAQEKIDEYHKKHPSAPRPLQSLGIDLFTFQQHLSAPFTHT